MYGWIVHKWWKTCHGLIMSATMVLRSSHPSYVCSVFFWLLIITWYSMWLFLVLCDYSLCSIPTPVMVLPLSVAVLALVSVAVLVRVAV